MAWRIVVRVGAVDVHVVHVLSSSSAVFFCVLPRAMASTGSTSRKVWDATSTWRKRTASQTTGSRGSSSWGGGWPCAPAVSGHPENSRLSTSRRPGPYAYVMRARQTAPVACSHTKDRHQERGVRLLTPPTTTSSQMCRPPSSSLGL